MPEQTWPSEWLRGTLTLAVLRVLADGPTYGYAIATTLANNRFGAVKGGTLYPLLARLEAAGHVETTWQAGDGGPGRKYFSLTATGREHLTGQAALWAAFAQHTTAFITEGER